jgi:hypothetical protein
MYECRNWEREYYNSVLEMTLSFLEIHKWTIDIYIGFSPALHLQFISVTVHCTIMIVCMVSIISTSEFINVLKNPLCVGRDSGILKEQKF